MATYEVHSIGGIVDCLTVHDPPLTYRCKREGDSVHVTRVNEQTGEELPSIYLEPHELPGSFRERFERKLHGDSR